MALRAGAIHIETSCSYICILHIAAMRPTMVEEGAGVHGTGSYDSDGVLGGAFDF